MRLLALALALAVFVVNPGFGCGEDFDFGAEEMRRVSEGTWELSFDGDSEPRAILVLSYQAPPQAAGDWSPVAPAHACSNRTFMASAGACVPSSGLNLHVQTLKTAEPFAEASGAGFGVVGMSFRQGILGIQFRNTVQVTVEVLADGTVGTARYIPPNRGPTMPGLRAVRRP